MNTLGSWDRVRSLFHEALEQPTEARDAFLSASNDSEDMRSEVRSLLAAHTSAEGFLETPAIRFGPTLPVREPLTLEAGDHVGRFEITGILGAGGMGEVYRARDSQLGREVAIKILPPAHAIDPQRLLRFERESRVLASLKHANVAAIHSIEDVDGLRLLVLELIEGPTLAERVKAGPVPLPEALDIARQLAEALGAAHACGIVHRDVKPANVKLSPSGLVTLLDFGLATARGVDAATPSTIAGTGRQTTAGMILGTCGYMSPEQARGQAVDKRADIWAFGCILFELLTGTPVFRGDTPSDTIAAVLERQPEWTALPQGLPESIQRLLRRGLEKNPDQRLHDIADARLEIDETLQQLARAALPEGPLIASPRVVGISTPELRRAHSWRSLLRLVPALLLLSGTLALGWWALQADAPQPSASPLVRFVWSMPAGLGLSSAPSISPDGRRLVFTASQDNGAPQLYLRALNDLVPIAIPRTEGAKRPFWSPDSNSVGYFASGKLMRVTIAGGAPVEVCAALDGLGGAWSSTGTIVFSPNLSSSGLMRVPATGGVPEPVTRLDADQGENSHRWPVFLPNGRHFVYFVRSTVTERRGVYLGSVDGPAASPGAPLFRSESEAAFAPLDERGLGVLFSVADGHVEARRFDTRRLALAGDPITLPLPAGGNTPHHGAMLSASSTALIYLGEQMPYGSRLASVLRSGRERQRDISPGIINWPRLSPDGTRLAMQRVDPTTGNPDIWVLDLARRTWAPVTRAPSLAQLPVWAPDSARLTFVSGTPQAMRLAIAGADGSGELASLPCPGFRCEPSDWSRDGRWIVVNALDGERGSDVWMLPTEPGGTPRALVTGPFIERDARLSPDGRLAAYVSEESGRPEISIRVIDGGSRRRDVVSAGGGSQPVWTRDGRELLFVDPEGLLWAVSVRRAPDGRPLLEDATRVSVPPIGIGHTGTQYDLSPDGRTLYFLDQQHGEPPHEVGIVLGWHALIR